jgi:hypothetical protein
MGGLPVVRVDRLGRRPLTNAATARRAAKFASGWQCPNLLEASHGNIQCAKCEGHGFERGLITPLRELRAVSVLQCASCGAVVGTLETPAAIEILQKQVSDIDAGLIRIVKALQEQ